MAQEPLSNDEQVIEAGILLKAEGRRITGSALKTQLRGGKPERLLQIWQEYNANQALGTTESNQQASWYIGVLDSAIASFKEKISVAIMQKDAQDKQAIETLLKKVSESNNAVEMQTNFELEHASHLSDTLQDKIDELQQKVLTLEVKLDQAAYDLRRVEEEKVKLVEQLTLARQNAQELSLARAAAEERAGSAIREVANLATKINHLLERKPTTSPQPVSVSRNVTPPSFNDI